MSCIEIKLNEYVLYAATKRKENSPIDRAVQSLKEM